MTAWVNSIYRMRRRYGRLASSTGPRLTALRGRIGARSSHFGALQKGDLLAPLRRADVPIAPARNLIATTMPGLTASPFWQVFSYMVNYAWRQPCGRIELN